MDSFEKENYEDNGQAENEKQGGDYYPKSIQFLPSSP